MSAFSVLMSVYCKENPEFFDISLKSNLETSSVIPDEFVLICDGDLTPELEIIISKYKTKYPERFKVYRKENGGLGKALSYGLPKCSYSLVARSDSDDVCAPERFEKQVTFLDNNPDVSILGSYIDEFDGDWTHPMQIKEMPLNHDELYEMAKFRNPLNHMSVMMRKDDIINIGSYRHIPYVEDYDLWVRAMCNGLRIANIGEVLVHARTGAGMIKRRGTKKYIKSWHRLNMYMIHKKMIGYPTYIRNMFMITVFVFMPVGIKELLYKKKLRK